MTQVSNNGDKLGAVRYGHEDEPVFLGRELTRPQNVSEETARVIDEEIRRITSEGSEQARRLLNEYRDKLAVLAESLLEFETLDGDQVMEIIKTGKLTRPAQAEDKPDSHPAPPAAAEPAKPPLAEPPLIEGAPAKA
ncbi:MAG: hypothetical protein N2689_17695 [Verrucomicrobiae bacterium]|nr:hypothetical protein [Verrucomicrobiae bacterium]